MNELNDYQKLSCANGGTTTCWLSNLFKPRSSTIGTQDAMHIERNLRDNWSIVTKQSRQPYIYTAKASITCGHCVNEAK